MTEVTKAVGRTIRERRRKAGLTQRDLASAMGCADSVVCLLEQGGRLSLDRLVEVSEALGCLPSALLPQGLGDLVSARRATRTDLALEGDALVSSLKVAVTAFRREVGRYPRKGDGEAAQYVGEPGLWLSWNACLRRGGRGTNLFCTLREFCEQVDAEGPG